MASSPQRKSSVFQRFKALRRSHPRFSPRAQPLDEQSPLLPVKQSDLASPSPRRQSRKSTTDTPELHLRLPLFHPESPQPVLNHIDMNTPTSPSNKGRKSGILGASRKVVSTASRPLRALGRAVGGRKHRPGEGSAEESLDGNALVEVADYGTLEDGANGDGSTSVIIPLNNSGSVVRRRGSRSGPNVVASQTQDPEWSVHSMEAIMRTTVLMCWAYIAGCRRPEWEGFVSRISEYAITAWATCLVILGLAFLQKYFSQVGILRGAGQERSRSAKKRGKRTSHGEAAVEVQNRETLDVPPVSVIDRSASVESSVISAPEIELAHPALADLYVIDASTGDRVLPNTASPYHMSNEWFECDMLVLVRTPDVDDPKAETGQPYNTRWVNYLRGRQRRFEFQYQLKLKKVPKDQAVYFSCELEEPIKMGMIQRAFVGAAMAFMKSTNPTFHYSITGSKEKTNDGKYEKPHMAFTVEGSLDRLVVTKPGEEPPKLGTEIQEDPESIKKRKKGVPVQWNLEDTYTMALWTSYVDFLDWRVINLPGIRPFGLASVLGTQAFHLGMYLIDEQRGNDRHYQKDITTVVDLELSNDRHSEKGHLALKCFKASEKAAKRQAKKSPSGESRSTDDFSGILPETDIPALQAIGERSRSLEEGIGADIEEEDDDAETAAELGEGIYMRSGDSACLREHGVNADDEKTFYVANGGGFAILQEQDSTVIVEKSRRSKKNRLIKSGDTVMFKRIQQRHSGTETRYLTIHRGWWLKWVLTVPKKNGYFTIHAHEEDFSKSMRTSGSMSQYLTMGCSFTLRHKRWSRYHVGIAAEPSTTYGGRMLGLYNPAKTEHTAEEQYQPDDGEADEEDPDFKADKASWMKPLILTSMEPPNLTVPTLPPVSRTRNETSSEFTKKLAEAQTLADPQTLIFSSEHAQADVPAWIEMMNRTQRVRQLTYVVRVTKWSKEETKTDDPNYESAESADMDRQPHTFVRLRNGRELARIMRVGQSVRYTPESPTKGKKPDRRAGLDRGTSTSSSLAISQESGPKEPSTPRGSSDGQDQSTPISGNGVASLSPSTERASTSELATDFSFDSLVNDDSDVSIESLAEEAEYDSDGGMQGGSDEEDDIEDAELESETEGSDTEADTNHERDRSRRKKRGVVGKSKALIGKSIKATAGGVVKSTKLTGKVALATGKLSAKAVVGAGKLTGKAGKKAVNVGKSAGRAVIAPVSRKSKKPPKAEPKTKNKEKGFEKVSRTMKKMAKKEKKKGSPDFMAGELCAPEQSRRTASRVLARMSQVPMVSPHWKKFNAALTSQVEFETEPDQWFLEGTSVELGVVPLSGDDSRGKLIHESIVARCLWESHWREEWCGMYDSCLSFYTPLSKTPCTEIAFIDITNVRPLDASIDCPLPGFPVLVVETAWLCHYLAFHDEEARDTFGEKVEHATVKHIKQVEDSASLHQDDLRKARFWQGFQSLSESTLSTGGGKWARLSSKDKLNRMILNGRRMVFDPVENSLSMKRNGLEFVENLTSKALSFSFEALEKNPAIFVEFLDMSSQLRSLALDEIDFSSKHAFCLFANIYHCLLQQAMLLSVNGPLHKRSAVSFMRTACYEIGGDVFSLAEIYCCVLRGKMCKPANPKPPYMEPLKKSHAYRYYALDYNDPRVNFVLNTGDIACPRTVPVLRPSDVERQLNEAAELFLKGELTIDAKRRTVILPKVCEVYKSDFGGDAMACLKFCMGGLDEGVAGTIRVMTMDTHNLLIRYKHTAEQYHASLTLREDTWNTSDEPIESQSNH